MQDEELKRIVEAALLASSQPLTVAQLASLFEGEDAPSHGAIARILHGLQDDCAGRGVELVEVASGFRYQVRSDVHAWVSKLWAERPARYSRALLETLSLIAYRQPVTRGEIEQVRGVAVSTNIIRTLEEREWVRIVGYRDVPGKPALYGTTKAFLDYFKLQSLDQLPPLSEVRDLESFEPQLELTADGAILAAIGPPDNESAAPAEPNTTPPTGDNPDGAATIPTESPDAADADIHHDTSRGEGAAADEETRA